MEYQVTKIDGPYNVDKQGNLQGHDCPEGHRFEMLKGKGEKGKPMVWYIVPDLSSQFVMSIEAEGTNESAQIGAMLVDLMDKNQKLRLNQFDDGELAARDWILSAAKLAERYFVDGRSLGVSQEEMDDWITKTLQPAMMERVNKSLASQPEAKRKALVAAVTEQFRIAATRGNSLKGKFLTEVALRDLQQRLNLYADEGSIERGEEFDALLARIAKHLGAEKQATDLVESF